MKKHLLFLINTLRDGGAEKILVDLVNKLDPQKYDIEVKLIYKKGVYLDKLNENIKLSFITKEPGTFIARQVSRMLPRLSSEILHKLFIRKKYDIEIAFLEGYATKIIAGAPKNTKKLAWVHCDLMKTEWINGVFPNESGFKNCYKKFDEVISVSQSVQDAFIERFGYITNLSVKYNPIDCERIKQLSNEKIDITKSENKITLISIGRLTYPKNFMRLLSAFSNIKQSNFNIELWILGEGEERTQLEEFIKSHNLNDDIHLLGFKKNPYPYLKNADLYVCSSRYEGYSTTVTEATVLGIPVLTTNVAGMKEILGDNEYGIITENDDIAFENELKHLLNNKDSLIHFKKMAKQRSNYFNLNKQINEIEKLFL